MGLEDIRTLSLKNLLSTLPNNEEKWIPQVLHTVATEGRGIKELVDVIESHYSYNQKQGIQQRNLKKRYKRRVMKLISDDFKEYFWNDTRFRQLENELEKDQHNRKTPYLLANQMLEK